MCNDPRVDENLYVPTPARLVEVTTLTSHEKLFVLELEGGRPLGHQPGQFVQVSIFGCEEAPISICSAPAPSRTTFELCIRRVGRLTNIMHKLKVGDSVGIRGPFGHGFPMADLAGRDIIMISGGLGMAPLRSLIQACIADRDRYGRLTLLYGVRGPDKMLFRDEIEPVWAAAKEFDIQLATYEKTPGWKWHVGSVTQLIRRLKFEDDRTSAVLVTSPKRYRDYIDILDSKGMSPEHILLCLERHMRCGVGKCGHCMIYGMYCCKDGPVFTFRQLMNVKGTLV